MSKKMMKRSLALGALMAFVITGSAMAAEYSLDDSVNVIESRLNVPAKGVLTIAGKEDFSQSIVFKADETVGWNKRGAINVIDSGGVANISNLNKITIDGTTDWAESTIFHVNSYKNESKMTFTNIGSIEGSGDGLKWATIFKVGGGSGNVTVPSLVINADKVDVQDAYLGIHYAVNGGVKGVMDIDVTDSFNLAATYGVWVQGKDSVLDINAGNDITITGTEAAILNYKDNSTVNLSASNITIDGNVLVQNDNPVNLTADKVTIAANKVQINQVNAKGEAAELTFKVTEAEDDKVEISVAEKGDGVTAKVEAGVAVTDAIKGNTKEAERWFKENIDVEGATAVFAESEIYGETIIGADGKATYTKNTANTSVSEAAAVGVMAWRTEMNDMNKRLGELRDSEGEHGVWVRMVNGEAEYGSVENEYKTYQFGYDEKLSTDPSWTVGIALSYTEGDTKFAKGSGENDHKGLNIYGSKLNADGSYIDLIAKYARLDHNFNIGSDKGDWDTNGYSVSAEYGKRFTKENGMWIEPQVELSYGKVGSAEYVVGGRTANQEGMESLVGRVGFRLGKNISKGNVYARASYLYDFEGETNVTFAQGTSSESYEQDLGGGWWEVGVGANINLSKATYIYADVEKTFGGEVDTNWQWNLGVRYSF